MFSMKQFYKAQTEKESLVQKRKLPDKQAVELTIELAPYIQAYKNYKHTLDIQKGSKNSPEEITRKNEYERLRIELLDGLTALTGGCWEDVFDMAMGTEKKALKNSAAYQALDDSFIEILNNVVDENIAKHMESSRSIRPVQTLKAVLCVTIDDHTHPENIIITCVDNGRGYKKDFLEQVESFEAKNRYISQKSGSNKRSSHAKSISPDIDIFTGGRGLGLRMLISKINTGAPSESARKYTGNVQLPQTSEIDFSNKLDSTGRAMGAVITITTSKPIVEELDKEIKFNKLKLPPIQSQQAMKKQMNALRDTSPLSINTDFSDEDLKDWGPGTS